MARQARNDIEFSIRLVDEATNVSRDIRMSVTRDAQALGPVYSRLATDVSASIRTTVGSVEELDEVISGTGPTAQRLADGIEEASRRMTQGVNRVSVKTDNYTVSLRRAEQATERLGRETKKTGAAFSGFDRFMSKILIKVGIFGTIRFLVQDLINLGSALFRIGEGAAQLEDISLAFERMAGRQGDALALLRDIDRASGGVIDRMTLMQAATRAAVNELPIDQFDELVTVTRGLAAVMGRDATESLQRMTDAIVKQERELLDEFGFIVRVDDAVRKYAIQHNKAVDALTAHERQLAFFNAVLDEGQRKLEALGGVLDSNQQPFLMFRSSLKDLATEFGGLLNRSLNLGQVIGDMAEQVNALALALASEQTQAAEATSQFGEQIDILNELRRAYELANEVIPGLQEKLLLGTLTVEQATEAQKELTGALKVLDDLVPTLGVKISNLTQSVGGYVDTLRSLIDTQTQSIRLRFGEKIESDVDRFIRLSKAIETVESDEQKLINATQRLSETGLLIPQTAMTNTAMNLRNTLESALRLEGFSEEIVPVVAETFRQLGQVASREFDEGAEQRVRQRFFLPDVGAFGDAIEAIRSNRRELEREQKATLFGLTSFLDVSGQLAKFQKAVAEDDQKALVEIANTNQRLSIEIVNEMARLQKEINKAQKEAGEGLKEALSPQQATRNARKFIKTMEAGVKEFGNTMREAGETEQQTRRAMEIVRENQLTAEIARAEKAGETELLATQLLQEKLLDAKTKRLQIEAAMGERAEKDSVEVIIGGLAEQRLAIQENAAMMEDDRETRNATALASELQLLDKFINANADFVKLSDDQQRQIRNDRVRVINQIAAAEERARRKTEAAEKKANSKRNQDLRQTIKAEQIAVNDRFQNEEMRLVESIALNEGHLSRVAENEEGAAALHNQLLARSVRLDDRLQKLRSDNLEVETAFVIRLQRTQTDDKIEQLEREAEALRDLEQQEALTQDARIDTIRKREIVESQIEQERRKRIEKEAQTAARLEKQVNTMLERFRNQQRVTFDETVNALARVNQLALTIAELDGEFNSLNASLVELTNLLLTLQDRAVQIQFTKALADLTEFQTLTQLSDFAQRLNDVDVEAEKLKNQFLLIRNNVDDLTKVEIDEKIIPQIDAIAASIKQLTFRDFQQDLERFTAVSPFRQMLSEIEVVRRESELLQNDLTDALANSLVSVEEFEKRSEEIIEAGSRRKAIIISGFVDDVQTNLLRSVKEFTDALDKEASEVVDFIAEITAEVSTGIASALSGNVVGVVSSVMALVTSVFSFARERRERETKRAEEALKRLENISKSVANEIGNAFTEGMDIDFGQIVQNFVKAKVVDRISTAIVSALGPNLDVLESGINQMFGFRTDEFGNITGVPASLADVFTENFPYTPENLKKLRDSVTRKVFRAVRDLGEDFEDLEPQLSAIMDIIESTLGTLFDSESRISDQIPTATFRAVTEPQANQMLALLGSSLDFQRQIAINTARTAELLQGIATFMPGNMLNVTPKEVRPHRTGIPAGRSINFQDIQMQEEALGG